MVTGVKPRSLRTSIWPANAAGVTESARITAAGASATAWYIRIGTESVIVAPSRRSTVSVAQQYRSR